MQQLSFKNRIAFNYIISTALLVFVVFFVILTIAKYSVYKHINDEIEEEIKMHFKEMTFSAVKIVWIDEEEWKEREHNAVSVNPVFVEIKDLKGNTIEKSPNLKKESLNFLLDIDEKQFYDTTLKNQDIRLSQTPIIHNNVKVGYLLIAKPLEEASKILDNLKETLFILYPIILLLLFVIARIIAGRSIKPVSAVIETTERITKDNLSYRIQLPQNRDELYTLSKKINSLLDRIENAVEREKQFTSDASHELRTPLAIVKGTLEVLVRKPREKEEYQEKINFCISEIDRLNNLVDELLLLARFENQHQNIKEESIYLNALILDILTRYSEKISNRKISAETTFEDDFYISSDYDMISIIISNLISNALKYSNENGKVHLSLSKTDEGVSFEISNSGAGIPKTEMEKIFNPFFRSSSINTVETKGVGLGLSIVKRLCDLLKITIEVESEVNQKTTVQLLLK
jgi:signal transduction histidine kinase